MLLSLRDLTSANAEASAFGTGQRRGAHANLHPPQVPIIEQHPYKNQAGECPVLSRFGKNRHKVPASPVAGGPGTLLENCLLARYTALLRRCSMSKWLLSALLILALPPAGLGAAPVAPVAPLCFPQVPTITSC